MTDEERVKLLVELEEAYRNARTNPDISLYKLHQLHLALQCLHEQLWSVDEEEMELIE